ncbi:MAG: hypothetical protein M3Q97_08745, partial [Bacteroidota bacterium]|nr:hypothetical protein [Bacteroidota bacterium]
TKGYSLKGEFQVRQVEAEFLETVANHSLLANLASRQGGKMIYPSQMEQLPAMLEGREDIRPIAYMQTDFRPLIEWRWLFALVLLLLAAEWFIRKYFGSY